MSLDALIQQDLVYDGIGFSNYLPTGIITLDLALGGGIPLNGSIIEVYGEESSGKTTLSYRFCKRCTEQDGGYVTWVDSETSYDDAWAQIQGVNTERLIPYRPTHMEAGIKIIVEDIKRYKDVFLPWLTVEDSGKWKPTEPQKKAAGSNNPDEVKQYMEQVAPPHVIVWDSIAASPVKTVAEGDPFGEGMAYRARLIKAFISRYNIEVIGCDKIGLILINQVIENIGAYKGGLTTPGGRGLRHGKHLSLYVKKIGYGDRDDEQFTITDLVRIGIVKNKVTPIITSFPIIFSKSKGYLGATSLVEYLYDIKWFQGAGAWKKFTYRYVDEDGVINTEEVSIQKKSFYEQIKQDPTYFYFLAHELQQILISKFPMNETLRRPDVDELVAICLGEESALPTEEDVESSEQAEMTQEG